MRLPSNNPITLPFGSTDSPYSAASPHRGTDFSYQPDSTIYAPFSGKVALVPNNGNDGNGVYMTDDHGRFHGMLHTSKYVVSNGQVVDEGQPVAIMGQTGYAFGVHLHWAVKENGRFIDPLTIVKGEDMTAEKVDLYVARVFAYGILGRNGQDGTQNALAGAYDDDLKKFHVGQPLTDAYVMGLYDSPEAVEYRNKVANPLPAPTPPPATLNRDNVLDYVNHNLK
jgi:hypothetical protein